MHKGEPAENLPLDYPWHGFEPVQVVREDGTQFTLYKIQFCDCCRSILDPGHSVCPNCVKRHCLGELVFELASINAIAERFGPVN